MSTLTPEAIWEVLSMTIRVLMWIGEIALILTLIRLVDRLVDVLNQLPKRRKVCTGCKRPLN